MILVCPKKEKNVSIITCTITILNYNMHKEFWNSSDRSYYFTYTYTFITIKVKDLWWQERRSLCWKYNFIFTSLTRTCPSALSYHVKLASCVFVLRSWHHGSLIYSSAIKRKYINIYVLYFFLFIYTFFNFNTRL